MPSDNPIDTDYEDVVYVPVETLVSNPDNPNEHTEKDITELMESIRKYGFRKPILVMKDMMIIDGHARTEAMRRLGQSEMPVLVSSMTREEAKAYMISQKSIFMESEWDTTKLPIVLNRIEEFGESPEITGIKGKELDAALGKLQDSPKKRLPSRATCPGCGRDYKLVPEKKGGKNKRQV
jgi:ParB-like chromosome segregation protein Spo0J